MSTQAMDPARRARFLDATRGIAMLLVLLAHFRWIYLDHRPEFTAAAWMNRFTMIAAPTFMVISGLLLGFVQQTRPHRFEAFRIKLVDRGLFLLTVGHVIITAAYLRYGDGVSGALRYGQILDAVGLAIILGPWLVTRLGVRGRTILAIWIVLGSWALLATWHPASAGGVFVKDTLVGGGGFWSYNFPLLPWQGLYVLGTVAGSILGARLPEGLRSVRRALLAMGGGSVALALLLSALHVALGHGGGVAPSVLREMTSPLQHLPPAPAYFLFYGGAGLLLMAAVVTIDLNERLSAWLRIPEMIGRNSLFIFLLQEHIYVLVLWSLGLSYFWWWPVLFLLTAVVAVGVTAWWDRQGLGKWLTVGYGRIWGPGTARAVVADS